jgi:hypothetical protein
MNTSLQEQVQALYEAGLEKFAGDQELAKSFVEGFVKEAFSPNMGAKFWEGGAAALGGGLVAAGLGLGIHGLSSALSGANEAGLKTKFEAAFAQVKRTNPVVIDADPIKVRSYAETIFKFAPRVAADPNLLSSVLASAVHGEGVDTTTIRALADLDARVLQ